MNKAQKDNLLIKKILTVNEPFFIGRIAGCELKIAHNFLNKNYLDIADDLKELENNAGIKVINNDSLRHYIEQLVSSYDNCTMIAEWEKTGKVFAHTGVGQKLIAGRTINIPKIDAKALEPYYFTDSWMTSLKGKQLLIIHPFSKTFLSQITKFKKIFPNRPWFEDCELQFVEPPLTLAGNHQNKDWHEHYNTFIESLKGVKDYDIALVAAGGYGMLISNYIFKELGKSVMYIGGALQIFFGVIGKRWFDNKEILKLVNDDWIRPSKDERPSNYTNVEQGCYW